VEILTVSYEGPAGVVFSDDDLLIIWSYLSRIPTAENSDIRRRIHKYLELDKNKDAA